MVTAVVNNRIWLPRGELDPEAEDAIVEMLTLENLDREDALKWDPATAAEMPEEIFLHSYSEDEEWLSLPRGFAEHLMNGMEEMGIGLKFDDRRTTTGSSVFGRKPRLRDYQEEAEEACLYWEDLIYQAPGGSGKTVTLLSLIRRLGMKAIVVVHTKDIAKQWKERAQEHLGVLYPVSLIGDNEFEISSHLTVATVQTLWSKREELDEQGFFDMFGVAVLDECHHATANTFQFIMDRFSSTYRIGASYTPDKTGDFRIGELTLGPVRHKTPKKILQERGIILTPEIRQVSGDFGKDKGRGYGSGRGYQRMQKKLLEDRRRNWTIVAAICENWDNRNLVLTKRHEHIDTLEKMMLEEIGYPYPILRYTGKESGKKRIEVQHTVPETPCLVFATVADEAVDIPALDRGYLVFPQSNMGLIRQQLARYERTYPGKDDAIVYDFIDRHVGVLKSQATKRWQRIYLPEGYKISRVKGSALLKTINIQ